MKRIHWIAIAACLFVIVSAIVGSFLAKPAAQQSAPTKDSVGVSLHLSDFSDSMEAALADLGVRWVRIDWEIGRMAPFMQEMDNNGISALAIIDHVTMNWQNFTLADWQGNVSAIVASSEAKGVDAWEIWNEPNAPQFFLGYMDGSP
jgi:hypothetical protein